MFDHGEIYQWSTLLYSTYHSAPMACLIPARPYLCISFFMSQNPKVTLGSKSATEVLEMGLVTDYKCDFHLFQAFGLKP